MAEPITEGWVNDCRHWRDYIHVIGTDFDCRWCGEPIEYLVTEETGFFGGRKLGPHYICPVCDRAPEDAEPYYEEVE